MAWFRNNYECYRCGQAWQSEWSCMCDDDCPNCGARHMEPVASDDLTEIIIEEQDNFIVARSPDDAEHEPEYMEVDHFGSFDAASTYLSALQKTRGRS